MVLNAFKLSILHGLSVFVNKTGKGNRSTFFPISPRPGFESWIFSHLSFNKGGWGDLVVVRRQLWHIRKQGEVLGMAETVRDSAWALNDSAGNRSRRGASWSVNMGPGSIPERMSVWERIIPSLPESMGSSNMRRREEKRSR
jgi:hypothetical protein